jgi:hypothetical protein
MPNLDDIALANLRESLKKFDLYLQLAILASLAYSAVAISLSPSDVFAVQASVGPLSVPLKVTISIFLSVSLGAAIVFGMMAAGALDHIYRALRHLASNRAGLIAACGYPSLATLESKNTRCAAILASPAIIALASLKAMWGAPLVAWLGLLGIALFAFIPFIVICLALLIPLDDQTRYEARGPESAGKKVSERGDA